MYARTHRETEREKERDRQRVGRKPDDVVNPSASVCSPYPFRSRHVVLARFFPLGWPPLSLTPLHAQPFMFR